MAFAYLWEFASDTYNFFNGRKNETRHGTELSSLQTDDSPNVSDENKAEHHHALMPSIMKSLENSSRILSSTLKANYSTYANLGSVIVLLAGEETFFLIAAPLLTITFALAIANLCVGLFKMKDREREFHHTDLILEASEIFTFAMLFGLRTLYKPFVGFILACLFLAGKFFHPDSLNRYFFVENILAHIPIQSTVGVSQHYNFYESREKIAIRFLANLLSIFSPVIISYQTTFEAIRYFNQKDNVMSPLILSFVFAAVSFIARVMELHFKGSDHLSLLSLNWKFRFVLFFKMLESAMLGFSQSLLMLQNYALLITRNPESIFATLQEAVPILSLSVFVGLICGADASKIYRASVGARINEELPLGNFPEELPTLEAITVERVAILRNDDRNLPALPNMYSTREAFFSQRLLTKPDENQSRTLNSSLTPR